MCVSAALGTEQKKGQGQKRKEKKSCVCVCGSDLWQLFSR